MYKSEQFCLEELLSDKVRFHTCDEDAFDGVHLSSRKIDRNWDLLVPLVKLEDGSGFLKQEDFIVRNFTVLLSRFNTLLLIKQNYMFEWKFLWQNLVITFFFFGRNFLIIWNLLQWNSFIALLINGQYAVIARNYFWQNTFNTGS